MHFDAFHLFRGLKTSNLIGRGAFLMRHAALLAVAAAENFTVFPVRCYLAEGASMELLEVWPCDFM